MSARGGRRVVTERELQLTQENARLHAAFAECNRGLGEFTEKLVTVGHAVGFSADEPKHAIAERLRVVNAAAEADRVRLVWCVQAVPAEMDRAFHFRAAHRGEFRSEIEAARAAVDYARASGAANVGQSIEAGDVRSSLSEFCPVTTEPVTFHGPQFGISRDDLRNAVNASCSCGGKPDTDAAVCPACMVWHRLTR